MSSEAPTAEGVLEYLIKSIVENPDAVSYTHLTLPTKA